MSSPFRDELAAANEKIVALEREIQMLKAAKVRVPWGKPHPVLLLMSFATTMSILAAGVAVWHARKAHGVDPTFRGVAVAPHDGIPPVIDPGNVATKSPAPLDSQNPYKSDKACNCQPGDPLCSCL